MTTYYSDKHITACAAYIVGYPALVWLLHEFGVFDFIMPDYTLFDLMGVRTPPGLSFEETGAVAYCIRAGPLCYGYGFASEFVPLTIVWGFVTGKIFNDRPAFASAAHPGPPKFVHFVVWLALVPVVILYVVFPFLNLFSDLGSGFSYTERWAYLPQLAFPETLAYFVAACLVTRHSIRIRVARDPRDLFDAVLAGNAEAVVEQLAAGSDPNIVRHEDGAAPLHVAARAGETEVVLKLQASGADPDVQGETGATPLHVAARAGETEIVLRLLASGADPEVQDETGATPLHVAARVGETEVVNTLLAGDADTQVEDYAGATPMHVAARACETEIVNTLLAGDADTQAEDETGATPLHVAAAAGAVGVINVLLDVGADPNARSADGRTPLDLAVAEGHTDAADALRETTIA